MLHQRCFLVLSLGLGLLGGVGCGSSDRAREATMFTASVNANMKVVTAASNAFLANPTQAGLIAHRKLQRQAADDIKDLNLKDRKLRRFADDYHDILDGFANATTQADVAREGQRLERLRLRVDEYCKDL